MCRSQTGGRAQSPLLEVLGDASWLEGDYEQAMKLAEESLKLSREANDMGGMANSLFSYWAPLQCGERETWSRPEHTMRKPWPSPESWAVRLFSGHA